MYRVWFWFVVLVLVGCLGKNNIELKDKLLPVDSFFLTEVAPEKMVRLYGFLVKKNDVLFLYQDKKSAGFEGSFSSMLRVQVWFPELKLNSDCLSSYVAVYGKKQYYLGAPAIDDIILISSMEKSDFECSLASEPINYFESIRP